MPPQTFSARTPEDFPCQKEKSQSMKCLDENNFDYSKCDLAFENFKFCMKFWEYVRKVRQRHQITPFLPPPEERAEIYIMYKATGEIPDYSKISP